MQQCHALHQRQKPKRSSRFSQRCEDIHHLPSANSGFGHHIRRCKETGYHRKTEPHLPALHVPVMKRTPNSAFSGPAPNGQMPIDPSQLAEASMLLSAEKAKMNNFALMATKNNRLSRLIG